MDTSAEPMLLENGDILVPTEDGTEMVKLRPGQEGHAEWLAHLQRESPQRPRGRPAPAEARQRSAGRTAARFGLGVLAFIVIVIVLLVIAALVIVSLVDDISLPDLPDIPGLPDLPEDTPGGSIGPSAHH